MQYSSLSTSAWVVSDRERERVKQRESVFECCERKSMERCDEDRNKGVNLSATLSPSGGLIRMVALMTHFSQT